MAVCAQWTQIVELLLDHGADINALSFGWSALHTAVAYQIQLWWNSSFAAVPTLTLKPISNLYAAQPGTIKLLWTCFSDFGERPTSSATQNKNSFQTNPEVAYPRTPTLTPLGNFLPLQFPSYSP
jgi:hypothetical protein